MENPHIKAHISRVFFMLYYSKSNIYHIVKYSTITIHHHNSYIIMEPPKSPKRSKSNIEPK